MLNIKMYALSGYHYFIKYFGKLLIFMAQYDVISVKTVDRWLKYHSKKWSDLASSICNDILNKIEGLS